MESNKSTGIIVGVIALVLIVGGIIWFTNRDSNNNDTATDAQNTTQTEQVAATDTIVVVAQNTEDLSTLVSAVQAADLVETLQGTGPYTVFAPTNDAFNALPAGTLDTLLQPENKDQLSSILTYHVVAGDVKAADLSDGQVIDTVQGEKLTVSIRDGKVYIKDAKGGEALVTTADVAASNGTVHIINSVLLPQ